MDSWISQLRKGLAEYVVLLVLNGGEAYGYQILQQLAVSGNLNIGESTVYPLLGRLTREGNLAVRIAESPLGPSRRYYQITATGRARLSEMERYWATLVHAVQDLKEGNV